MSAYPQCLRGGVQRRRHLVSRPRRNAFQFDFASLSLAQKDEGEGTCWSPFREWPLHLHELALDDHTLLTTGAALGCVYSLQFRAVHPAFTTMLVGPGYLPNDYAPGPSGDNENGNKRGEGRT